MPVCLTCARWAHNPLCAGCRERLRRARPVAIGPLRVTSGLIHDGPARRLVHLLKYDAVEVAGLLLARVMASLVPTDATAIVPVPRALLRRLRYGIDPARKLAHLIAADTGLPVVDALVASPWWPSHAGADRESRRSPRFHQVKGVPPGCILVDDVLTTGATAAAAASVAGSNRMLTATRADSGSFG